MVMPLVPVRPVRRAPPRFLPPASLGPWATIKSIVSIVWIVGRAIELDERFRAIEDVIEIKLTDEEQAGFDKSAAAVQELVDALKGLVPA